MALFKKVQEWYANLWCDRCNTITKQRCYEEGDWEYHVCQHCSNQTGYKVK